MAFHNGGKETTTKSNFTTYSSDNSGQCAIKEKVLGFQLTLLSLGLCLLLSLYPLTPFTVQMTYFEVSNKKKLKRAFIWPLSLSFSRKFGKRPDSECNMAERREPREQRACHASFRGHAPFCSLSSFCSEQLSRLREGVGPTSICTLCTHGFG